MDLLFVVLFAGAVASILALLIALKILSREVEDKGIVKVSFQSFKRLVVLP